VRLLFVAARFPFPPWRGDQARAFHQLRLLGRRHHVTLLTHSSGATAEGLAALRGSCAEFVLAETRPWAALGGLVRSLVRGLPLQVALFASPDLRRKLAALLAEERHDLVHVQLARAAAALPEHVPVPVVIDLIDALSLNLRRRAGRERGLMRWAARVEAGRLRRYERALCRRADRLTMVSPADREVIGDFPNLGVNPNGVDLERFRPPDGPRDARRLVFCGNLGYFPNVEAVRFLVRDVMPRVWRAEPEARLTLVGARPARALRRLARDEPRVTLVGEVPDLQPHLASAALALAPLRSGSGQLFKVLEALACATPLVATPLALAGLDVQAERHLLVGDSPDELARAAVRLLRDPALGARLGAAGRAYVEARHSWERTVGDLEALYDALLEQRAP
jgi:sugar transferase (PEP-CTERM/EpsH1 system associated)